MQKCIRIVHECLRKKEKLRKSGFRTEKILPGEQGEMLKYLWGNPEEFGGSGRKKSAVHHGAQNRREEKAEIVQKGEFATGGLKNAKNS